MKKTAGTHPQRKMANPGVSPLPPQAPLDQLPMNAVFGSHAASVVPSLIFPGRDSSAYCRTVMAILNAKEKHTELFQVLQTDSDQPASSLEPLLAGILLKDTLSRRLSLEPQLCSRLEPPYLCYGFLIYFLLFHVHCFFWLQCMMDVYGKMYLWENNYSLLI